MGCVQAKPSLTSPNRLGIERLKADHGYLGGGGSHGRRMVGPAPVVREVDDDGDDEGAAGSRRLEMERRMMMMEEEEMVDGWPRWLVSNVPKEVLAGLVPKSADSYVMIGKVGQGTYSNVYKARDRDTGKIVALKKVRFDTSESESIRFMAREIMILQKLDHPNVLKLEGLATSRMQYSLYLVFEYMLSDLARIISRPDERLTEPQVKCYMHQLLSGLQHCHERGILHRDIKGSNLLIDKNGVLKIGDFGLANYFSPNQKRPLTSRVVTLWYRAPELLLGATDYGAGIDLWSAGCLLAEMLARRPIMPGRTEVEQLHRIFTLCGSPSDEYWRKLKLSTNFRPPQPYESSILEAFRDFPSSSLGLLTTLLALEPSYRGSAASALQNEFFSTSPLACDLSGLPVIYKGESDDSIQPRERRRRRSSTLNPRLQSHIGQMKLEHDVDILIGDSSSSKEEEKSGDMTTSFEPSSSTASSSSKYAATSPPSPVHATSPLPKHSPSSPLKQPPSSLPNQYPSLPLSNQSPSSDYHPSLSKSSMDQIRTEFHPSSAKNIMNLPNTEYYPSAARNIMTLLPKPASTISIADMSDEDLDGMQLHAGLNKRSVSMSEVGMLARDRFSNKYNPED